MSLEITGKLVEKMDAQQVNDRFRKREFVLELAEEINGNVYTNYAKMQLVQAKCDILDRFNLNDNVKVNFNIKGNRWERDGKVSYITNLDVWRIENAGAEAAAGNNGYNNNANAGYSNNGQNNNGGGYNNNNGGQQNYGQQQPNNNGGGYNNGGQSNYNNNNGGNSNNGNSAYNNAPATENADDLPF